MPVAAAAKLAASMTVSAGMESSTENTCSLMPYSSGRKRKTAKVRTRIRSRSTTSHDSTMNDEETKPPARTSRNGRSGRFVMSMRMPVMVWETTKRRTVSGILQPMGTGSCQSRLNDM